MTQKTLVRKELEIIDEQETVPERPVIKVLSYNIWNHKNYWQERLRAIIAIIKEQEADVVCLTEVNSITWSFLKEALEGLYIAFQIFAELEEKSGTVLLLNRNTTEFLEGGQPYYYDFEVFPGRVIGAELYIRGLKIHVLATELAKGYDNDSARHKQLLIIKKVLDTENNGKPMKNYILMGDFNMEPTERIRWAPEAKCLDVWAKLGCPSIVKNTYDGKRLKVDKLQARYTKILYKDTGKIEVRGLSLHGKGPTSDDLSMPPSVNYGLLATFKLKSC